MKLVVSATGKDLDSSIDPRFGRCRYILVVETDDMSFEAFENESMNLGGGAGIQTAQFVASKQPEGVITGNCGPNAIRVLSAAGVNVVLGQTGTVRQAIEDYKNGRLKRTSEPNVPEHYGMGDGLGQGRGGGMGGGTGCRRGTGRGSYGASKSPPTSPGDRGQVPEASLRQLKDQVDALRSQMEVIESSIKRLERRS